MRPSEEGKAEHAVLSSRCRVQGTLRSTAQDWVPLLENEFRERPGGRL